MHSFSYCFWCALSGYSKKRKFEKDTRLLHSFRWIVIRISESHNYSKNLWVSAGSVSCRQRDSHWIFATHFSFSSSLISVNRCLSLIQISFGVVQFIKYDCNRFHFNQSIFFVTDLKKVFHHISIYCHFFYSVHWNGPFDHPW